jgi:hypothetical protein
MDTQRGGAFTVSGWVALALLAVTVTAASTSYWLGTHRTLRISCPATLHLRPTVLRASPRWGEDSYKTHIFPADERVCTAFGNECWIRI